MSAATAPRAAFEEGVPLAGLTTLGVGGPARWLVRVRDDRGLAEALAWAERERVRVFVLGGGSNLVVADAGFDGLVIQVAGDGLRLEGDGDRVELHADAGVVWDGVVERAVEEGLAGVEALSGIPGRVGAAPIQNVGAYGQEVADVLVAVDVWDRQTRKRRQVSAAECGFAYRRSRFQTDWRDRKVVLGITLRLARRANGRVAYPELARRLGVAEGGEAPIADVRAAVRELRDGKAMLLPPAVGPAADPDRRSVGSFFVNPVVDAEAAEEVRRRAAERTSDPMPAFPSSDGRVKLSAAWLIERAGFPRGTACGRVGLSTRHALAITNRGGATAAEVVRFAAEIRMAVREAFGIRLRPEPVFVGFGADGESLLENEEMR